MHEIRADVLRFTVDDTAALLKATGLALSREQVAVLHARTEGWAAGLRLAALALRRTDDPVAFLAQFSGDERSVAEYLTGEILDGLNPDTQDFLRVVSVCSPMPAALAVEPVRSPRRRPVARRAPFTRPRSWNAPHPASTASIRCSGPTWPPISLGPVRRSTGSCRPPPPGGGLRTTSRSMPCATPSGPATAI